MRIHDIAVIADPNLRVPSIPEPEEVDDTYEYCSRSEVELSPESRTRIEDALTDGATKSTTYWI